MNQLEREVLRTVVLQALSGRGAHVPVPDGLDGLDWRQAGITPPGGAHTVFQIVNHLVYWQDFSLAWIDGEKPVTPQHDVESWPGEAAPGESEQWSVAVERFLAGLHALEDRARRLELLEDRGPKTVLEILQLIASHNSYHLGQIAWLRQSIAAWPPPQGGATW